MEMQKIYEKKLESTVKEHDQKITANLTKHFD